MNLVTNPSSEATALIKNNVDNDATVVRTTDVYYTGAASTVLTKGAGYAFVHSGTGGSTDEGSSYTVSAWVKSSASPVLMVQRGVNVPYSAIGKPVAINQWTRISQTYTVPTGASGLFIDFGRDSTSATSGSTLYVDGILMTKGSTLYDYADSTINSSWSWTGTPNNSTPTGPAP